MKMEPLNKIFAVVHGNKLDMNKMHECKPGPDAIAFIGRSGERGGVAGFVERVETVKPFEAGLITVALGGSALSSFLQSRPFYTAQNIDVLRPLEPMSMDVKLYYCLCIEADRFRYSTFGREANRTLKTLLVPSRDSVPQWVKGATKDTIKALCEDLGEIAGAADHTDDEDPNPRNTKWYSAHPLTTEQAIRKAVGVPEPKRARS